MEVQQILFDRRDRDRDTHFFPALFAQFGDFYSRPGYSSFINTMINNRILEASMAN